MGSARDQIGTTIPATTRSIAPTEILQKTKRFIQTKCPPRFFPRWVLLCKEWRAENNGVDQNPVLFAQSSACVNLPQRGRWVEAKRSFAARRMRRAHRVFVRTYIRVCVRCESYYFKKLQTRKPLAPKIIRSYPTRALLIRHEQARATFPAGEGSGRGALRIEEPSRYQFR